MPAVDRRSHMRDHRCEPIREFPGMASQFTRQIVTHIHGLLEQYVLRNLAPKDAEAFQLNTEYFGWPFQTELLRRRHAFLARFALVVVVIQLFLTEVTGERVVQRSSFSNVY